MISFDTELYGHWWFEGVTWLKHLVRQLHQNQAIQFQTGSEYLEEHPPKTAIELPESSWGQGGHYWVWQNHLTEWMWPIIHRAENKMKEMVEQYPDEQDPLKKRVLNQLLRELLLLEGSDWPFLVTTFQAKDYAIERFEEHVQRFWSLADMLDSGELDETHLKALEDIDNPFPTLDYKWFTYERKISTTDQTLEEAAKNSPQPVAANISH
jgi:1,4-alpha-glucan branching enzyme